MTQDQIILCAILAATTVLFVSGRLRHDLVAMGALMAAVLTGLVPTQDAFSGFGNAAVITVACVLILSHALQRSGAVDVLARSILPKDPSPVSMIAGLAALAALLSAFMNNVGALALLMPIALKASMRLDIPPGQLLMPLAFGSILGGMTTMIGTPPNLIVADYRAEATGEAFRMFDFTPVGLGVALTALAFIILFGWRLVPVRKKAAGSGFDVGRYFFEVTVVEGAKAAGMTLRQIERAIEATEIQVLGLVRREQHIQAPSPRRKAKVEEILIIEAEPECLSAAISKLGLSIASPKPAEDSAEDATTARRNRVMELLSSDDSAVELSELVIMPNSPLIGRSPNGLNLRHTFHISLLAITRQDRRKIGRFGTARLRSGDVLLVQGDPEAISAFATDHECLPLADRPLGLPSKFNVAMAAGAMLAAIAAAALGVLSAPISFALGVLVLVVSGVVPLRGLYQAVDWPVIVLLACMLPVARAVLDTGAADLLASSLFGDGAFATPIIALGLLLLITMTLSDVMNNAATVAVMAPIALGIAGSLGTSPDAFLMAVAIGGSCAFLTPIGHQNNTLILAPGGFRFGDYWRLGLPVQLIVVAVALPLLMLFWG
ncbi:MAG: SLC13 family permease [Pseudomonadota bacterium]